MNKNCRQKQLSWLKSAGGIIITFLCLLIFFRQINVAEVVDAFQYFHWGYLPFGIASLALGYLLRILRWSMMLRATGAQVSFNQCRAAFLGSIALNNVLPLRLGDVIRALVFPRAIGISKITATSSLVIERLLDLITLLGCLAVGIFAIQKINISVEMKHSALYLAALGGMVLILGFLFSARIGQFLSRSSAGNRISNVWLSRIFSALGGLLTSFSVMSRPRLLLMMFLVSFLVWGSETGLYYAVLLGLEIKASPIMAFLVMSIATLSTLLPSSPGYIGSFHLAAFTAVMLIGTSSAQAGAYAVIVHLALWLSTTLAGAWAISMNPELFRSAKQQPA